MKKSFWQKQLLWGVKTWQLLAFVGGYLFFACQYWLTIWYTTGYQRNNWKEAFIDYFILKLPLTIPLWWLFFVKFKNKSLVFKLTLHAITVTAWIFIWFNAYRWIQDYRGQYYLKGAAIWWDVYIPFLVYCIQFGIFHLYDFYVRNKKQQLNEKILMQLAHDSEMNVLKSQIQPHFLFNTLNSISASVPPDLEKTREMIAKLADTFRFGLRSNEKNFITIKEELDFIQTVLELEKERFKDRLQYQIAVDPEILACKVPPMILQPMVENAVKHGISSKIKGGAINVNIERCDKNIHFHIEDNGTGSSETIKQDLFAKGIGLKNVQQRLERLYGEKINVRTNQPTGLIFSFKIPASV